MPDGLLLLQKTFPAWTRNSTVFSPNWPHSQKMFSSLRSDIIVLSYHWFWHLYLPHATRHTWPIHCGHKYQIVTFLSHLKLWKFLCTIYSNYFNTRKGSKEGSDQLWKERKIEGRVVKCGRKEKMKGWHKRCNRNWLMAEGTKGDIFFSFFRAKVCIYKNWPTICTFY